MRIIKLILLAALMANAAKGQPPAMPDSLREEIPIQIDYEKEVTPYIIVTVDKTKVKAVFDTGSSGLRVLDGALSRERIDSFPSRVKYGYGQGAHYFGIDGRLSTASIKIGKLTAPVRIMRIDSTCYGHDAAWISTDDSALIASGHFRDCPAIIGVGLRSRPALKGIVNPIAQLPGSGKFIVEFPVYGGKRGRLVINPHPEEEKGFILFHLKPDKAPLSEKFGSWLDNDLNGCMIINEIGFCHSTLLDSGNPFSKVSSDEIRGDVTAAPGDITVTISDTLDPSTVAVARLNIIDKYGRKKSFVDFAGAGKEDRNIFGICAFFAFDVLYDLQNGYIGLKQK